MVRKAKLNTEDIGKQSVVMVGEHLQPVIITDVGHNADGTAAYQVEAINDKSWDKVPAKPFWVEPGMFINPTPHSEL